ncbi:MAG: tRNA (guanine37-N1)-methyltransferase [Paracoccaceae bacterium]
MTGPGDKLGGPKGERLRLSTYEDAASIERVSDAPGAPGEDRVTVSAAEVPSSRRPAPTLSHGTKRAVVSAQPRSLEGPMPEVSQGFTARVLTLFPDMFPGPLGGSLTGKALKDRIWSLEAIDIRGFATDKHRSVDAPPAGGGPGLVMKADVLGRAFDFAARGTPADRADWPVIYLSPRGKRFDQAMARRLSAARGVTLLCGRFEGVDQRVLDARGVEEVSLGDFVLTGGEIAAMALLDATVRLIPRVLGNAGSLDEESFSSGLLEHPQYTKPAAWEGREIPDVLLSGHHGRVADWRRTESEKLTKERRPDLWRAHAKRMKDPDGA